MRQRRASGPQVRSRRHLCFCASRRVVFRPAHVGRRRLLRRPRAAVEWRRQNRATPLGSRRVMAAPPRLSLCAGAPSLAAGYAA
ncbi:hypothetical protein MTO96_012658 [Rhipicephalus appendiculatus]